MRKDTPGRFSEGMQRLCVMKNESQGDEKAGTTYFWAIAVKCEMSLSRSQRYHRYVSGHG